MQRKTATRAGIARAENPFLTAFSRQKLVEAVPAERVRLKRKSNSKVIFQDNVRINDENLGL
ncbi:hypothetical protein MM300_03570 [Evansella sp. LMS18]|uniref:hypothetical protein n=1 Tax=Evansella sp. LMS18 TaxID=2924033 RepID=UPI0020D069B6|nr:hypothetical protein [Evansella sp. LMS18]UTR11422.1 hypothetical protein MM300_03570 [Evansella sp. LMS18]